MKRLHIHIGVEKLDDSMRFYTALFGAAPVKVKEDYAKWMLDDPRINFAISTRSGKKGLDHLGLQVDNAEDLEILRQQLSNANLTTHSEGETTCCYAKSEKSWVTDPDGTAWEAYHTMEDAQFFSGAAPVTACSTAAPAEDTQSCGSKSGGCC